jgi:hypothetical protein
MEEAEKQDRQNYQAHGNVESVALNCKRYQRERNSGDGRGNQEHYSELDDRCGISCG